MARLKAHGIELLRLQREFFVPGEEPHTVDGVTTWTPVQTKHYEELSYRSDGKILRKSGYWQTGSPYQADHWYDWGWKLYKKLRPGTNPVEHVNHIRQVSIKTSDWRIA